MSSPTPPSPSHRDVRTPVTTASSQPCSLRMRYSGLAFPVCLKIKKIHAPPQQKHTSFPRRPLLRAPAAGEHRRAAPRLPAAASLLPPGSRGLPLCALAQRSLAQGKDKSLASLAGSGDVGAGLCSCFVPAGEGPTRAGRVQASVRGNSREGKRREGAGKEAGERRRKRRGKRRR